MSSHVNVWLSIAQALPMPVKKWRLVAIAASTAILPIWQVALIYTQELGVSDEQGAANTRYPRNTWVNPLHGISALWRNF
jgi:hypothetical protein